MNRGSPAAACLCTVRIGRFNEAPIHESGKCHRGGDRIWGDPASMRPRFMNRGSATGRANVRLFGGMLQ